jgi:hypothetical protein
MSTSVVTHLGFGTLAMLLLAPLPTFDAIRVA